MKLYYFLTILVGVMILMNLAGINTSSGYLLTYLGIMHPEDFQSSQLYNTIAAIFIAAVVSGVVIGFFTKASPESILIAPLAGILLLFVGDIISIITYVSGLGVEWAKYVILAILAPLAIGYIISVVEFWRGND